ncbi:MAG: hypothetical protein JKY95_19400 [Planctomycetaceae bacterium]|nr:hypothetical protein [Planctomycetaceae bacterium]
MPNINNWSTAVVLFLAISFAFEVAAKAGETVRSPLTQEYVQSSFVGVIERKHTHRSRETCVKRRLKGRPDSFPFHDVFPDATFQDGQWIVFVTNKSGHNQITRIVEFSHNSGLVKYISKFDRLATTNKQETLSFYYNHLSSKNEDVSSDAAESFNELEFEDLRRWAVNLSGERAKELILNESTPEYISRVCAGIFACSQIDQSVKVRILDEKISFVLSSEGSAFSIPFDAYLGALLICDKKRGLARLKKALKRRTGDGVFSIKHQAIRAACFSLEHDLINEREFFAWAESNFSKFTCGLPRIITLAHQRGHRLKVESVLTGLNALLDNDELKDASCTIAGYITETQDKKWEETLITHLQKSSPDTEKLIQCYLNQRKKYGFRGMPFGDIDGDIYITLPYEVCWLGSRIKH